MIIRRILRNCCGIFVKYSAGMFLRLWTQNNPGVEVPTYFRQMLRLYTRLTQHPFFHLLVNSVAKYWPPGLKIQTVVKGLKWNLNLSEVIDSAIYFYGYFEHHSTKVVYNVVKKNMVVFDIGANIGYYTLLCSSLVGENGKVYAFEPMSEAMNRIKEHCRINSIRNVVLERKALAEITKPKQPVSFQYSYSIVGGDSKPNTEYVDFISLDDYVTINRIPSIDFMKIDVDGYEYKVISGGKNAIKRFKPLILIELGKYTLKNVGDSLEELVGLLHSLGYSCYHEKKLKPLPSLDVLLNAVPENGTINVLCKPYS